MRDFTFYSPTKILFGKRAEERVAEEIARFGSRVLIHYGGGSAQRSGLLDRIRGVLEQKGLFHMELGGVVPNPRLGLVREGIRLCRENGIDFILAVGGGSVIDSSKAIALGVPYGGDVWDFYAQKAKPEAILPLGAVLTIAAAGSEASDSSVLTHEAQGVKVGMHTDLQRPLFAAMNPELTFTLPAWQTASGGMDIMAHAMERYFTKTEHVDLSDRLCEAVLKTVIHALPAALRRPDDYDARAELMWAGTLAHNDLLGAGREQDWATHKLGHAVSAFNDATHGATLGVLFPAWMKYVYREDPRRFAQFACRVWDVDFMRDDEAAALEGIRRLEGFVASVGLPTTLSGLNVPEESLGGLAASVTQDGRRTVGFFKRLSTQDVLEIYRLAR